MVDIKERLADYGLTLEPDVVICDRRTIDEAVSRIAELEAENERLQTLVDVGEDRIRNLRLEAEALSRTGAVKVKPLEWSDHPAGGEQALGAGLGLYRVHANGDDWYLVPDHMGNGGKAAAQADYERRILSALEPAAPKGPVALSKNNTQGENHVQNSDVIPAGHGGALSFRERGVLATSLPADNSRGRDLYRAMASTERTSLAAPEGQQAVASDEAETVERNPKSWIAWKREAERLTGELAQARGFSELSDEWIIELAVTHSNYKEGAGFEVFSHTRIVEFARALLTLTRPSEQAVTEAMVERACDEYRRVAEYPAFSDAMRAALRNAMEAGRHE